MSDDHLIAVQQELALLKAAFEAHLVHRELQRDADTRERDNAKAGIDKRLDGMNEFREALRDQSGRFVERREFDAARDVFNERLEPVRPDTGQRLDALTLLATTLITRNEFENARAASADKLEQYRTARDSRTEAELAPLRTAIAIQGKPNWALVVSIAAITFALISGGWLVIGLKIDTATSPLALDLASTKTATITNSERLRAIEVVANASSQADIASRTDRLQMTDRLHALEAVVPPVATVNNEVQNLKLNYAAVIDRLATIRSDQTQVKADLVEIETQFCGEDNLRNQIHAFDMRLAAMLWRKVFDTVLPTDNAFYAQIGKCLTSVASRGR